jgi:predicted DNA-binding transcriptional regulator AlpA
MNTQLLKLAEVVDLTHTSAATVARWRDAGVLPAVVIGGVTRFRLADVEALIARSLQTTDPAARPGRTEVRRGRGAHAA